MKKEEWAEKNNLYEILNSMVEDLSWEEWRETGSTDKEELLTNALLKIEDDSFSTDELYDLFWYWANSLEESDFEC